MDKKICPTYVLPTRDTPENKNHTQTESKGWKKIFQANGREKSLVAILTSEKNRFQNKGHKKKQKRSLHNTEGKNSSRHKYCKYICSQRKSTQQYKRNLRGLQEIYRQQHTYTKGL